jgi:hypothetical protein
MHINRLAPYAHYSVTMGSVLCRAIGRTIMLTLFYATLLTAFVVAALWRKQAKLAPVPTRRIGRGPR